MILSSRIKEILEILLDQRDFLSVDELSEKSGISRRTMYREIQSIKEILKEYNLTLSIVSKKGIKIGGATSDRNRLNQFLNENQEVMIIEQEKRADFILLYLLHQKDYVKMEAIAIDNRNALSTLRSDLKNVSDRLSGYELQMIQQKGQGIIISGPLMEKNQLIADILINRVDEVILYRWINNDIKTTDPFLNRITEYGYKEIMQQTHRHLKTALIQDDNKTGDMRTRDYLLLVFLLSLMIYCHNIGKCYDKYLEIEKENPQQDQVIQKVLECILKEYPIGFSKNELTYVKWAIEMSVGRDGNQATTLKNQTLNGEIICFMDYVENRMGIYLSRDRTLREGLYSHMDKALVRIRSNIHVTNPVLSDIKSSYEELFGVVKEGVRRSFPKDYFPDDEIGYVVLYFAVALDNFTKKIFNVLVVCSGGMGSSKMLASALRREIPEIGNIKTTSIVAMDQEKLNEYDLILSTIPLYLDETAYLRVSPVLHENEIQLIRDKIKRHKHNMLRRIDEQKREEALLRNEDNTKILYGIQQVSKMSADLVTSFRCFEYPRSADLKVEMSETLAVYQNLGFLIQTSEKPLVSLAKDYIFLIPTTSTVYYEEINDNLSMPIIFLHRYSETGCLKGDPDSIYQSAVFVLYPETLNRFEKDALSSVIEFIIEDSDFRSNLAGAETEYLKGLLSMHFRKYISNIAGR